MEDKNTAPHETLEGTPREPLLAPRPSTHAEDTTTTTPTATATTHHNDDASPPPPSAALLGCCTLALVLVGLAVVLFVCFLPLWLFGCGYKIWTVTGHSSTSTVTIIITLAFFSINMIHLRLLWVSPFYLYIFRTFVLPIRRLLVPLVPMVCRIESIREQQTTQYYQVPTSNENGNSPVFRKSVRRHYKRMQKIYQRHNITGGSNNEPPEQQSPIRHVCVRAETSLCLREVVPLIWEHQQRSMDSARPIDDFIKRALIVVVVPDGILDLYYIGDVLVSVQFSILQGTVWHWFMYFCHSEHCRYGIWWHGALLAIQRGHELQSLQEPTAGDSSEQDNSNSSIWVNAQTHQQASKLHAGYSAANHTQRDLLSKIYPEGWISTSHIPESVLQVRLWDD